MEHSLSSLLVETGEVYPAGRRAVHGKASSERHVDRSRQARWKPAHKDLVRAIGFGIVDRFQAPTIQVEQEWVGPLNRVVGQQVLIAQRERRNREREPLGVGVFVHITQFLPG